MLRPACMHMRSGGVPDVPAHLPPPLRRLTGEVELLHVPPSADPLAAGSCDHLQELDPEACRLVGRAAPGPCPALTWHCLAGWLALAGGSSSAGPECRCRLAPLQVLTEGVRQDLALLAPWLQAQEPLLLVGCSVDPAAGVLLKAIECADCRACPAPPP